MAYGLKYELLCTTLKGNLYKARLYFDGYAGGQIDRDVPVDPFSLRKDKAAIIRGTSFEFSIRERVDFEFLEFYSNNAKKVKVEFLDGSNNLIWTGYNLPQQYQVPYTPAPTNVMFTATDGLGLLKNESFGLTGRKSQLEIICYCIDKIGLGLGYSIAIGLHEVNHNAARSPLEQTFENAEIFENLNCYEVIEKILNKYNAEITQRKGKWAITRMADKKSTRLLYTSAGVYSATEAAPAVLNMGMKGDAGIAVWPRGSLNMSVESGARQVRITHDYGRRSSLFTNPAFGWSIDGGFTYEPRFNDLGAYAFLPGRNNTQHWIYKTIALENAAGEDFVFSVKMAAMGSKLYGGIPIAVQMAITMEISITNGVSTQYLTETGWVATPSQITKKQNSTIGGEPRFNEVPIITKEIPFDGDMTVKLGRYRSMNGINDSGWTIDGIAWADLNVYFVANGQLYASGSAAIATFLDSTEPGSLPDIKLQSADAPDVKNSGLYYKNITYLSNGNITKVWPSESLLHMLTLDLASDNRCAKQKLIGEIRGNGITFDSIIKHAYNSNREFEIAEGTWKVYYEFYSVTLLELLAWSDEIVQFDEVTQSTSTDGTEPAAGAGSANPVIVGDFYTKLAAWFEVVNAETADEYLRCKLPFGCDYEIQAFNNSGNLTSLWAAMPYATDTVVGGIKVGSGLQISSGVLSVSAGGGMVYPGAGIALSTGSAWGSPITNNSGNWNTAFGWGNHAGLYTPVAHATNYSNPHSVTASQVGLGNVTNESKAVMFTNPTFTGTVTAAGVTSYKSTSYHLALYSGVTNNNGILIDTPFGSAQRIITDYNGTGTEQALKIGTWTNRDNQLVLLPSGNVGIGTSSPTTLLHLNRADSSSLEIQVTNTSGIAYFGNTGGNAYVQAATTGKDIIFYGTSELGRISSSGSLRVIGEVTAYYSSSRLLKQNINYQFSGLDLIDRMKPVTYRWNQTAKNLNSTKDDRVNYGMIADEMARVAPDLIHKIYEKYDAIDYIQVIPILVKAVQELRAEVKLLRS